MRIVAFFKDKTNLLWGGILKNSKCICWVLATLILCFSFYVYQEVSFATERLGHSIEKASMAHNLRGAKSYMDQQNQTMFLMDRVIKEFFKIPPQSKFVLSLKKATIRIVTLITPKK